MNASQFSLDFKAVVPTHSPINIDRISGQNRKLLDYLLAGNKIHCMHHMKAMLGIGYLNSRIADLRKFLQFSEYKIESEMIKVADVDVKEYWITKV